MRTRHQAQKGATISKANAAKKECVLYHSSPAINNK